MHISDLSRMILTLPAQDRDYLRAVLTIDAAGNTEDVGVLDLLMQKNDAEALTIRGYLKALLKELWVEQECFSGKRPFGNSGWTAELEMALVNANRIRGKINSDGYLDSADSAQAHIVILKAIDQL